MNGAFLRAAAQELRKEDTEQLNLLIARGILIEGSTGTAIPPPPLIEIPTHDLSDEPISGARWICLLQALGSEARMAWMLRTRPFQAVLDAARIRPSQRSSQLNPARRAQEITAAGGAIALMTRSHDRCLVRALAVHTLCGKSGVRSKLVIGVIAHPFTAHCWVQFGTAVLVGGYEQARLYTPILVME